MKKLLTLFVFVATMLSFAACSSDDDSSIVGTWKLTKEIRYASPNDATGTNRDLTNSSHVVVFKSDGTYKSTSTETHNDGTTDSWVDEGTYTYKNGKISTSYVDDNETYIDIADVKFKDNYMIISYLSEDYGDDPYEEYKSERYFTRQ